MSFSVRNYNTYRPTPPQAGVLRILLRFCCLYLVARRFAPAPPMYTIHTSDMGDGCVAWLNNWYPKTSADETMENARMMQSGYSSWIYLVAWRVSNQH